MNAHSPDEVAALFDAAKNALASAPRSYFRRPIPDEIDRSLINFFDVYLRIPAKSRRISWEQMGQTPLAAETLCAFSTRMCSLAVRESSLAAIRWGLAALTFAGAADDQEFTWSLPPVHDATLRLGLKPEDIFGEIAATRGGGQARIMQIFKWQPDERRLQHFHEAADEGGFRYEPN